MAHEFRVWAPAAEQVELELPTRTTEPTAAPQGTDSTGTTGGSDGASRRLPMTSDDGGWWSLTVDDAGPGTDYLFRVDGGDARPDPRSPWQPHGVHGPSRVLDHEAFTWHDDGWDAGPLAGAVVYELHIGTFTGDPRTVAAATGDDYHGGTFRTAIEHLDALVELGVTHVELMPVAAFAGRWGWGYDGVDLYAPHPTYGDPDDLKTLVDACHQRGLAVLLDVVYNHLGPEGNYLGVFGPYFTDFFTTPWGDAVNLSGPGSHEVRRFLVDNALMWLRDYHIDGLRLDAVHALIDTSAVHILEQLATEVDELSDQLGRRLVLVAESDRNDPRLLEPRSAGGYGIDAHWNDDFHHAVHTALTGEHDSYYADYVGLTPLAESLRHAYVYRGQYSEHRDRYHGRAPEGLSGASFVGYAQNHDQIGNRARGERLGHLLSTDRLKIAGALVFTSPFVPMLFQGQEWAASAPFPFFADHHADPALAEAVRNGRMAEFAEFGWSPEEVADPESPATFTEAVLDWSERDAGRHAEMRAWYARLLQLRAGRPDLLDGRFDRVTVAVDDAHGTLVLRRGAVAVAVNLGAEQATLPIPGAGADADLLMASHETVALEGPGVALPPDSVAVIGL
ncbi:malto-oligosyltrehalose trehalohydrolase [Rhabdothermincola salaria]|uniref:malto-oligosyltrehalose trehalohydrolase n=1 Tax=Rhabdothermincola salaria TaxID=2903142 RepID=UPI001E5DBD69|nr:malto-oligosyltrehalose trehalohydrolase [Rhabdothermincola salaria]MCD9622715.1 malto-oligosyltrehalose trehalohydrolase [Rhabdothermincola salaria]